MRNLAVGEGDGGYWGLRLVVDGDGKAQFIVAGVGVGGERWSDGAEDARKAAAVFGLRFEAWRAGLQRG